MYMIYIYSWCEVCRDKNGEWKISRMGSGQIWICWRRAKCYLYPLGMLRWMVTNRI